MTLPDIFCLLNFFVRPTVKKWRQKCAKKRPKCAPPTPPDPPKPIFLVGGDEFYPTKAKNPHNFRFRCQIPTLTHPRGGPRGGSPRPPRSKIGQTKKHQGIFFVSREDLILMACPDSEIFRSTIPVSYPRLRLG